jgi:hypothetical protein
LRYCRSRSFTFVFFMQKLKGISSGQNNKSCRIIHKGSNKIGLTFFSFFCDFLRNLQESGNQFHFWSSPFATRTLERIVVLQCGPWGGRLARLRPNSGRTGGGAGRGRAGEGLGVARLRFEGLDRAEVAPASGVPAASEGQSRWEVFRRGCGQCAVSGGGGGSRGR